MIQQNSEFIFPHRNVHCRLECQFLITVIFTHSRWLDEHQGNNCIQALYPADFSWETDNIKPDVQLYIQLFLVQSVSPARQPFNAWAISTS